MKTPNPTQKNSNHIYWKMSKTVQIVPMSWFCFSTEGDLYFTTKLQNYTAIEKDKVMLVCELSKVIADVKWFKDGKEITPSKNIAIDMDGKKRILTVRKAEKVNIGEYTCDCGSDKTTATLNIEGRECSYGQRWQ